jgi:hypothetical protein
LAKLFSEVCSLFIEPCIQDYSFEIKTKVARSSAIQTDEANTLNRNQKPATKIIPNCVNNQLLSKAFTYICVSIFHLKQRLQ